MTILVTGAGLLGSQVAAKLVERGEKPILYDIVYDLESFPTIVEMNKVTRIVGDLLDLPFLIDVIKKEKINRIIHSASMLFSGVRARPYSGVMTNIIGTLNVLEAAKITNIERVVFTSSIIVSGGVRELSVKTPYQEDFTLKCLSQKPPNIYGVTKLTSEYLGLLYHELYGVDFVALRVGGLFGPWKKTPSGVPSRVADLFVRNAAYEKPVIIDDPFFTFSGVVDFVYSKDVAKGCVLACFVEKEKIKSRVYNMTWGTPYTFQDIIETTKKVFPGVEIKVREISKGGWAGMGAYPVPYDVSKIRNELGFEPDFNLETSFRDYGGWLKRHWPSGEV